MSMEEAVEEGVITKVLRRERVISTGKKAHVDVAMLWLWPKKEFSVCFSNFEVQ